MKKLFALSLSALACTSSAYAEGPIGFGPIKIGMNKESIEALKADDGIFLASPMTEYNYKNSKPRPGQDKFEALLANPLSKQPLKSVLTFEDQKLISVSLQLTDDPGAFDKVRAQISEKYGQPKVEDSMKDEQCVYRNGNSFKIRSGAILSKWDQSAPSGTITTVLSNIEVRSCPVNLRYGDLSPIKILGFSILLVKPGEQHNKEKNLF